MEQNKKARFAIFVIIMIFIISQAGCGSNSSSSSPKPTESSSDGNTNNSDNTDNIGDNGNSTDNSAEKLILKIGDNESTVYQGDPSSMLGLIFHDPTDSSLTGLSLLFYDLQEKTTAFNDIAIWVLKPVSGTTYSINDCIGIDYSSLGDSSEYKQYIAESGCGGDTNIGSGTIKITELGSVGGRIKGEYEFTLYEYEYDDNNDIKKGTATIKLSGQFDVVREEDQTDTY